MNALIVDDSRAMRRLLGHVLKGLGYQVFEAEDGQQALDHLRRGPAAEVILVDWNMPQLNGLQLVKAIRAEPAWAQSRILMVTTESDLTRMRDVLAAGADEYLLKPFTRADLRQKLSMLGVGT